MNNASYIAISRQKTLFDRMDTIANNVANSNTTGYKADNRLFQEYLHNEGAMKDLSFTHDVATVTDFKEGNFQTTERTFDAAIHGDGFFTVESPLGTRYTRAGNFRLNANSELVTQQGYKVLSNDGGTVTFQPSDTNIIIRSNGGITANGEARGSIGMVRFDNAGALEKTGYSYFKTEQPELESNAEMLQGVLENSNVESVREITKMIETSRAVGSTSKLIADLDKLQMEAMRVLGKTK